MVIAGTGGGKSAFTLNLTQQLIEQDYTVVVVEFGKSFSQLCKALSGHLPARGLRRQDGAGHQPLRPARGGTGQRKHRDALGSRAEILEAHVHKGRVGEGGGPHPFHPGLLRECP